MCNELGERLGQAVGEPVEDFALFQPITKRLFGARQAAQEG